MMKEPLPIFGHAVFPIENGGFYLFVPISDSLRSVINMLQNKTILEEVKNPVSSKIEYGISLAFPSDLKSLEEIVSLENVIDKLLLGLINERGGGFVVNEFNIEKGLQHSILNTGTCCVELQSNNKIFFTYQDSEGKEFRSYPLTSQGFNWLVLEAYQNFLNNNTRQHGG